MGIRIASSMYEENFERINSSLSIKKLNEPSLNVIKLNSNIYSTTNNNYRTRQQWLDISKTAAFFKGFDNILSDFIVMVYEDPESKKIGTVLFSILGDFVFNSLTIDHRSRFFVACKNLSANHKDSNVRRALAVTLLKAYSSLNPELLNNSLRTSSNFDWDETVAGEVASNMELITSKTPEQLGEALLNYGFLQSHYISSTLLDVIYDDKPEVIEDNNKLVFLLGKQLEHLFDPLTEYSPESTNLLYVPPTQNTSSDDQLVRTICTELIQLQESITTQLVKFLREVVVPTRMKSLTDDIDGLSASNVNQAFPPTIDEITRINCIFLEALTAAAPFGSFEIVKACGSTIPYFYKANMRHESAIRSFSESLKDFFKNYGQFLPEGYTERQIESIMKAPINLTKVKLILERLINTKNWDETESSKVHHYFKIATDTIDSFGKDELKPYNRRVFTPSGKILTEICEDWPSVLSYGWMNRKVISVFDSQDKVTREPGVIILFSDYIVFASVESDELESTTDEKKIFEPQVSNILMNSLVNENPIKNIPLLKVTSWTSLSNLEVTIFDKTAVRIIIKDEKGKALSLELEDSHKFLNILNKAKILSKTSPFHLFKNESFGFTIYATAHERDSYKRETTCSSTSLFLNIDLSAELLKQYGLFAGISAKLAQGEMILVEGLTVFGEKFSHTINSSELSNFLSEEVSSLETKKMSIQYPDLFRNLASANKLMIRDVISKSSSSVPLKRKSISSSSRANSRTNNQRRTLSMASINSNKPLPEIIDKDAIPKSPKSQKQANFVDRDSIPKSQQRTTLIKERKSKSSLFQKISQIFTKKDKSSKDSLKSKKSLSSVSNPSKLRSRSSTKESAKLSHLNPKSSTIASVLKPKRSKSILKHGLASQSIRHVSEESSPDSQIFDDNIPELSSFDDCKTFETSMTPIFPDEFEAEANSKSVTGNNWSLARDNSSKQCNLNQHISQTHASKEVHQHSAPFPTSTNDTSALKIDTQEKQEHVPLRPPASLVLDFDKAPRCSKDIPTFNSMDEEFKSPLLRVAVSSQENVTKDKEDEDIYYTPKSLRTAELPNFIDEEADDFDREESLNSELKHLDFGSFDVGIDDSPVDFYDDSPVKREINDFVRYESPIKTQEQRRSLVELDIPKVTENTDESYSIGTSSFKSCLSETDQWSLADLNFITDKGSTLEKGLLHDESFRYLANVLSGSIDFDQATMKNSESYKTLPRSYSSIKYLAAYIDNDVLISDLAKVIEEGELK